MLEIERTIKELNAATIEMGSVLENRISALNQRLGAVEVSLGKVKEWQDTKGPKFEEFQNTAVRDMREIMRALRLQ